MELDAPMWWCPCGKAGIPRQSAATDDLIRMLTEQAREGDEAVAVIARVRAIHRPWNLWNSAADHRPLCRSCSEYHPCPTIRALDDKGE